MFQWKCEFYIVLFFKKDSSSYLRQWWLSCLHSNNYWHLSIVYTEKDTDRIETLQLISFVLQEHRSHHLHTVSTTID